MIYTTAMIHAMYVGIDFCDISYSHMDNLNI